MTTNGALIARRAERSDDLVPRRHVLGLAAGFVGIGLLVNVTRFLLVFFYLPPDDSGLPQLVDDTTFLGVLNLVVVIVAVGRLLDAFTDPLIAAWSDRASRRTPMMAIATAPAALCVALLFITPSSSPGWLNVGWLVGVLAAMFIATTAYLTPLFALIKDLTGGGQDSSAAASVGIRRQRAMLSAITGAAWSLGIVAAAMVPMLVGGIESVGLDTLGAWRIAIASVCVVAAGLMFVPWALIEEPGRSAGQTSIRESLQIVRASRTFRPYLAADGAYWCGLMIVQAGLLYYATILLDLDRSAVGLVILLLVVISGPLQLLTPTWVDKIGVKRLYMGAFGLAGLAFALVCFLGRLPGSSWLQLCVVMMILTIPLAVFGGVSNGLCADIAEASSHATSADTTAMFFAVRTFVQKASQSLGLVCFAMLTTLGRDIGDDLGIRLSGVVAIFMYALAAVAFRRFDEEALQKSGDAQL